MPLVSLSPNVQQSDAASRKRTHDDFSCESDATRHHNLKPSDNMSGPGLDCPSQPPVVPGVTMNDSPASSPLTDLGSNTPISHSSSPNPTPSKPSLVQSRLPIIPMAKMPPPDDTQEPPPSTNPNTSPPPASLTQPSSTKPVKRKTPSAADKARAEKKQKQDEKEAEKAAKAAEKAQKEAEKEAAKAAKAEAKAKIEAEKEAAREAKQKADAEKEAAKKAKAAEKAKIEAEKEAKRLKKEMEEQAASNKRAKQQNMLAAFVKRAPATPVKVVDAKPLGSPAYESSPAPAEEPEPNDTAYHRQFKPFFLKQDMTLAPPPFEMDEKAKEAKSNILDEYLDQTREFTPKPFDPVEIFQLSGLPVKRGIVPVSVKKIMSEIQEYTQSSNLTESQSVIVAHAQRRLNCIPYKFLRFYEDVRPPYAGTMTSLMQNKTLRELSRRPTGKKLQQLNYDYDSEAEWVEEEGDDANDSGDDEEDLDGDEEMDDFLDDSEDAVAGNRLAFLGEQKPESTGICFENDKRQGPCEQLHDYRMEIILESLEHDAQIDPFSTEYWEPKVAAPPTKSVASTTCATLMPPPATPGNAFSKLGAGGPAEPSAVDPKDLVPSDVMEEFKTVLVSEEYREHTKPTVVDLLSKKFPSCTKRQIRTTVDRVAQRIPMPGGKKTDKYWTLVPAS